MGLVEDLDLEVAPALRKTVEERSARKRSQWRFPPLSAPNGDRIRYKQMENVPRGEPWFPCLFIGAGGGGPLPSELGMPPIRAWGEGLGHLDQVQREINPNNLSLDLRGSILNSKLKT